jgi:hypothetical protein
MIARAVADLTGSDRMLEALDLPHFLRSTGAHLIEKML